MKIVSMTLSIVNLLKLATNINSIVHKKILKKVYYGHGKRRSDVKKVRRLPYQMNICENTNTNVLGKLTVTLQKKNLINEM